ncbi:MAG: hypothetical protein PVG71_16130, partial [Anaerolineae bacterium]
MSIRSKLVPAALLTAGMVGLVLVVLALSSPKPVPGTPVPSQSAALLPGPTSSPSAISVATHTAPATSAATPTAAATDTPTPIPTPTPPPVLISSPVVSSKGQLAYVEDGELMVVGVDGSRAWVAKDEAGHGAQAVTWSPDGRWLLYVTGAGEPAYQVWDSQTGATIDLGKEVSGFPTGIQGLQGIDWSPKGSRLLFRGSPDESPGVWVLDLEIRRVWQVSQRAVIVASWVDEETILF